MVPPIDRIPDEILLKILDICVYQPELNELGNAQIVADAVQDIGSASTSTMLVCRRWSHIAREILSRSIFIRNVQDAHHLHSRLRLEEVPLDEVISWTPALFIRRLEFDFEELFLVALDAVSYSVLDTLVEILLSCPNLNTLSIKGPISLTDMNIGFMVSILLTASPALTRLELRIHTSLDHFQHFSPLNLHHRRSLKALWISPQALPLLLPQYTVLPVLHALVLDEGSRIEEEPNSRTSLQGIHAPILRSITVLSTSGQRSHSYHALAPAFPQVVNLLGCDPRKRKCDTLVTVGLTCRALKLKTFCTKLSFMQATSLTILFEGGEFSVAPRLKSLENNLFSIASKESFPQVQEIRLWLPSPSSQHTLPLVFESNERYAWKERLEKIGSERPELSFYIGQSDEFWRAKIWHKLTACEAAEKLLKARVSVNSDHPLLERNNDIGNRGQALPPLPHYTP